jgi:hypothetical protein
VPLVRSSASPAATFGRAEISGESGRWPGQKIGGLRLAHRRTCHRNGEESSPSTFGYHSLLVVQLNFTTPPWPALKGYASSESADARIVHSEPDIPIGCAERDLDMRIITLKVGAPVVEEAPPRAGQARFWGRSMR